MEKKVSLRVEPDLIDTTDTFDSLIVCCVAFKSDNKRVCYFPNDTHRHAAEMATAKKKHQNNLDLSGQEDLSSDGDEELSEKRLKKEHTFLTHSMALPQS